MDLSKQQIFKVTLGQGFNPLILESEKPIFNSRRSKDFAISNTSNESLELTSISFSGTYKGKLEPVSKRLLLAVDVLYLLTILA